jgi:hypothetical protein
MINSTAEVPEGKTEKEAQLDIIEVQKNRIITNKTHQPHTAQNRKI